MFDGLTSRWIIPWRCSMVEAPRRSGRRSGRRRAGATVRAPIVGQGRPLDQSDTRKQIPSIRPASWTVTIPGMPQPGRVAGLAEEAVRLALRWRADPAAGS